MSVTELVATYRVRLGDLMTPIIIQMWRDVEDGWLSVSYSHGLKTPLQASTSTVDPGGHHQEPKEAIRFIVSTLEAEFEQATDEGHKPDEKWIVPA